MCEKVEPVHTILECSVQARLYAHTDWISFFIFLISFVAFFAKLSTHAQYTLLRKRLFMNFDYLPISCLEDLQNTPISVSHFFIDLKMSKIDAYLIKGTVSQKLCGYCYISIKLFMRAFTAYFKI